MQRKSRIGWPHPLRFSKGGIPRKREAMFVRHRQQTYSPPNILLCPHACIVIRQRIPALHYHKLLSSASHVGHCAAPKSLFEDFRTGASPLRFVVVGYVVMAEHIHLLISEPDHGTPSTVMQVLKQRFARQVLGGLRGRGNSSQASLWQETLDAGHV